MIIIDNNTIWTPHLVKALLREANTELEMQEKVAVATEEKKHAKYLTLLIEKKNFLTDLTTKPADELFSDSEYLTNEWRLYKAFGKYTTEIDARVLNQTNLDNLYQSLTKKQDSLSKEFDHVRAINPLGKVVSKKDNSNYSYIKTVYNMFLITRLILDFPTNRSIIKVVLPILFQNQQWVIGFSKLTLLKIIYDDKITIDDGTKLAALQKMYGSEAKLVTRADSFKKYLLLPFIPGVSLYEFIANHRAAAMGTAGTLEPHINFYQQVVICLAIAEKLSDLHDAELVHHDLHGKNIIIEKIATFNYKITLIDTDDVHTSHSFLIQPVGTPQYAAPEIQNFRDSYQTDSPVVLHSAPSADIYSLGKIFTFILSDGKTLVTKDVYTQKMKPCIYPPIFNNLLLSVIKLVEKMLRETAADRPKIKEVIKELKKLIQEATCLQNIHPLCECVTPPAIKMKDLELKPLTPAQSNETTALLAKNKGTPTKCSCCVVM